MIAEAREAPPNLVALPEVFNWRGKRNDQAAAAETLDGQSLTLMSRLARELQIHIVAGSITERIAGEEKTYNTSVMLGPDGARMGVYRKIHLFDIELPGPADPAAAPAAPRGGGRDAG